MRDSQDRRRRQRGNLHLVGSKRLAIKSKTKTKATPRVVTPVKDMLQNLNLDTHIVIAEVSTPWKFSFLSTSSPRH